MMLYKLDKSEVAKYHMLYCYAKILSLKYLTMTHSWQYCFECFVTQIYCWQLSRAKIVESLSDF